MKLEKEKELAISAAFLIQKWKTEPKELRRDVISELIGKIILTAADGNMLLFLNRLSAEVLLECRKEQQLSEAEQRIVADQCSEEETVGH